MRRLGSALTHSEISQQAKDVLVESGLYRLPVDIDAVAKSLGISVIYGALDDDYSGLLVIRNGVATAHINAGHRPNRQRFSLAHEIAHFVLHEQLQTSRENAYVDKSMRLYHRADRKDLGQSGRMEWEANLFAAALLMPEELLRSKVLDEGYDLEDEQDVARLAVVLRVSEQALSIRLTRMKNFLTGIFDESAFNELPR